MYQDVRNRRWILLIILLVLLVCGAGRSFMSAFTGNDVSEETMVSIRKAVEQAALQCYVIEGAYPEDLDHLIENYGLRVNTKDFVIVYKAVADNRIPDIRVVKRER